MVSVTEQWAQYAVAGPRARDVLQAIVDPAYDLSNEAFPYLACGDVTVCGGTPARLFRLSFSGELAYEIAVPARFGDSLVRAIMRGRRGVRHRALRHRGARRVAHREGPPRRRRAERPDHGARSRFRQDAVGQEGFHRPLHGGAAGADRSGAADAGRLPAARPGERIRAGAHLIPQGCRGRSPGNDQGYVTSIAFSPSLGHWLGLGLLARGPERHGEIVRAYDPVRGGDMLVEVRPPCFIDPEGERLRV